MGASLATVSGVATGDPVNDAFGSLTQSFGTAITRVVPPRQNVRAWVSGFKYLPAGTAHTVTFMNVVASTVVTEDAESGQVVLKVAGLATAPDGSALATTDYFIVQHADGTWGEYLFASVSGLSLSFATNLTKDVKAGATVFYMAGPGDHSLRQYLTVASTMFEIIGNDKVRVATAANNGQPILVHSDNATAAGHLKWLAYSYGDA